MWQNHTAATETLLTNNAFFPAVSPALSRAERRDQLQIISSDEFPVDPGAASRFRGTSGREKCVWVGDIQHGAGCLSRTISALEEKPPAYPPPLHFAYTRRRFPGWEAQANVTCARERAEPVRIVGLTSTVPAGPPRRVRRHYTPDRSTLGDWKRSGDGPGKLRVRAFASPKRIRPRRRDGDGCHAKNQNRLPAFAGIPYALPFLQRFKRVEPEVLRPQQSIPLGQKPF